MSILENFRDKVVGVTRTAVRASGEFIEVAKINLAMKSEEDKAKEIMFEIGKVIFDSYKEGKPLEAELSMRCDHIVASEGKILEMKSKILELKNKMICPGCGTEVGNESAFCHHCGQKLQ